VFAEQREFGLAVIEGDVFPLFRGVASLTFGTKVTLVRFVVVLFMAAHTSLRSFFVLVVDVALHALHIYVLAQQFEFSLVVIEVRYFPIFSRVASLTLRP
jgi:hypothetical protein